MERLTAGHDAALNDLMERHATPVFHFLCRMVGNEDDANDLAQETFVRVFKSRSEFSHERKIFHLAVHHRRESGAKSFPLAFAASNISLETEMRRFRTNSRQHACRQIHPAPNEQALAAERAAAVRAAVGKLPEDLREAIVLCEWEELSVAEAATILETTPKAVESRLYRARQILRERLKGWL